MRHPVSAFTPSVPIPREHFGKMCISFDTENSTETEEKCFFVLRVAEHWNQLPE